MLCIHAQYTQLGFSGSNFMFGRNGGGGNTFVNSSGSSANTWYHLVMTYDGNSAYDIETFVDGSLETNWKHGI